MVKDISSNDPSQNVAVSGAYGSGKSSVLAGLLVELKSRDIKSIQVSLATLNQSEQALLDVSGEVTLTAALEKEVVKRLLYSAKPAEIPRSRFNRIGGFRLGPAVGLAAVIGAVITGAARTFGTELPLEQVVEAWGWWPWTGPVLDFSAVSGLMLGAQRSLSSFRLSQIALGPATLSLDDKDGNYFDHYLDEIVYFFQQTKTRVIIFEDLDRFNDPGIFLALRELNNLLNSSEQISQQVTFVHAIRDSLFVAAIGTQDADDHRAGPVTLPDAHARHGSDSAASDRAKFFDLIVPLVPFISHEVSADLLLIALSDLPEGLKPSRPLVTLAGSYFTDMRVIYSIRNEYAVFAAELLDKAEVRGLSSDQLFAMILYKHLHLDDFERIRTGESLLDRSVDAIRMATRELLSKIDVTAAELEDAIETGSAVDRRARAAGERLLANLDVGLRFRGWGQVQTVTVDATQPFDRAAVSQRDFWDALAMSESTKLHLASPNGQIEVTAPDVQVLLGADRNPKTWAKSEVQRDRKRLGQVTAARDWLRNATFSDLLAGPFPAAKLPDHTWTGVRDACLHILGPGLPFELLSRGYLDQNFALYTTKFHGAILSSNARTYLMQYVDRHRSEPLFGLSADDVDEILGRTGASLLADASALNVAIVDRLLESTSPNLPTLVETAGRAEEFIVTYLMEGKRREELISLLAGKREDILDVISAASRLSEADRRHWLSVSLSSLSGELSYATSPTTGETLERDLDELPVLTSAVDPHAAVAIADLMAALQLKVTDLSLTIDPMRTELANSGAFAINRGNLAAITTSAERVGLDTLGGLDDGVGHHVLANFRDYVAALRELPAATVVDDPSRLDAVVRAIIKDDPEQLGLALTLLPDGAAYVNLSEAPAEAYSVLAQGRAFLVSLANVEAYVATVGEIDEALAALMSNAGEITVDDTDDEARRQTCANALITSETISTQDKLALVASLKTSDTLDVAQLGLSDPKLGGGLLKAGEISDDVTTFATLLVGPWPVFEACAVESKKLPGLVDQLTLADGTLAALLTSGVISDQVKRPLLLNISVVLPVAGAASGEALLASAGRLGISLPADKVGALAQAGTANQRVIDYVTKWGGTFSAADLAGIFAHCESPFSGLASANGASFAIPVDKSFRPVLRRLKDSGQIRDFQKKRGRDVFDVTMAG